MPWMRILNRSVLQVSEDYYQVTMELTPADPACGGPLEVTESGGIVGSDHIEPFGFTATAGRVILAIFARRDGGIPVPPPGYTELTSVGAAGGLFTDGVAIFGKVAAGGETEINWGATPDQPAPSTSIFLEVSGADLADAVADSAETTSGAISTSVTPPAGRATMLVTVLDRAQDGSWLSPPAVVTGGGTQVIEFADADVGHPRLIVYAREVAADADCTVSATYSNPFGHRWYMLTVGLTCSAA